MCSACLHVSYDLHKTLSYAQLGLAYILAKVVLVELSHTD